MPSKQKIMGHSNFTITAGLYGKVSKQEAKKRFMRMQGPITSLKEASAIDTKKEDPIKILQLRFAKGEISKEEYLEMKKVL